MGTDAANTVHGRRIEFFGLHHGPAARRCADVDGKGRSARISARLQAARRVRQRLSFVSVHHSDDHPLSAVATGRRLDDRHHGRDRAAFRVGRAVCGPRRAERFARPIYLNKDLAGGVFRRNGEGDYHCSAEEVRAMLRDAEGKSQDLNIVDWAKPDVLDVESLRRYRNRMQSCRPGHVWLGLDNETFLLRIGAMGYDKDGVMRPTRAGLLMFGNEYNIVREFPLYFLDYREKFEVGTRWTDRVYSSSGEWSGKRNPVDKGDLATDEVARLLCD